jgi:hypothetical protein
VLLIFTLDGQELAHHHLVEGHQQRVVQQTHYHGLTNATPKPKRLGAVQVGSQASLPLAWDAPQVEIRPLHHYEQWLEVVV